MATIRLSSTTSSLSWTTGKFRPVSYQVYRTVRHSLVGRHGPKPCWDGRSLPPRTLNHSFSSLSVSCRRPDDTRRTSSRAGSLHGGTNPTRSTSYDSIPPQRARCKSSVALAVDDDESERGNNSNNDHDPNTTVVPFLLADIGEGIREVQVLQWHVSVGDTVQEFDTICQVQSDKATVDITSRYAGTIVDMAADSTILVGQPLVHIATTKHNNDNKDDRALEHAPTPETPVAPSRSPTSQQPQNEHVETPRSDGNNQKYLASPAVRKLAADHGIDPTTLTGTGPHGRVLKGDVLHYISAGAATANATTTAPVPNSIQENDNDNNNGQRIVTLSGYNRSMVQSMTDSLQIPHMALGDEIVVDKLLQFRQEWNAHVAAQPPQPQSSHGPETTPSTPMTKLGLQTLLVKACSLALTEFPAVNTKVHNAADCQVCYHDHHDIGVAMDTPHGLVVPVIRSVELKSLLQLQHEVDRLKTAAATGRTALSDLSPSPTFTLSNIGAIGVGTHMSPVLVPPLVAMGALGRIHKVPRYPSSSMSMDHATVEEEQPVPTNVLYVSWVADHRFLDGATLARFHQAFARYASNPLLMLPQLK